jgi:prolyl oligopeptidase
MLSLALIVWSAVAVAQDDDPYLWLEDVTGDQAMAWVEERNAATLETLDRGGYEKLRSRLLSILESDDRIPWVGEIGGQYYNFWQDDEHARGVWRRTSLDEYRKAEPAWETVLDLDALEKAEGTPWVWHGSTCLPPEYRRCLVALSNGGTDADVKREFDLVDKAFVNGGFLVPEAKSDVAWIDADTLLVMTDLGPDTVTTSGYPRQVRVWKRGTPLAEAKVVFEGAATDVSVGAWKDFTPGYEREFVYVGPTFFTMKMWERKGEELLRIDVPEDSHAWAYRDWLYVQTRTDWEVGGQTYPGGSLLVAPYEAYMAGERTVTPLFTPSAKVALAGVANTPSAVVIKTLDDVRGRVSIARFAGGRWATEPMAGLPESATISVTPVDPDDSDDVWITVTDFLTPTTLALGSVAPGASAPQQLKALPAFFDTAGLEITQHFATSDDGTKIPYFQVSKAGLKPNGKNPTILYGYGGFKASMTPFYSAAVGAAWLEKGGVYVLANIRGGGEYGPAWHEAARKQNRNKAYQDFASVAKDLVARKVTKPEHLGAMGGSNGGLLVGNMIVQYPELFGAVVCQVPLLDMKRYSQLLAGASWMDEYGDPADPEQWKFIQTFSPYHLESADRPAPATLFVTSTRDDRVHPGHARKMAAKMLANGKDVYYWEDTEGGHGAAVTPEQTATMWALTYSFLWRSLK